jgi:hypothetical protein
MGKIKDVADPKCIPVGKEYTSVTIVYGARFPTEIHARGVPLSFTPLSRLK